ncbi:MAG: S-layer homology domain-containing protein [Eubacteriales bacterium]|nr:S-layer homology domain-containing protein [Eubacteriales bacterium]
MKKIILMIALILALSAGSAYAVEFSDIRDTKYEEAVEFLSAYKIINGYPDGTFRPDQPITRGEVSKIATYMLGYGDFAKNMESYYTDMEGHWATRYVDIANAFDIVQGYLDGTFGPDNNITYSEAVTMVVRTLGYTDASLPGSWPYDYYIKAGDLGIADNIPISAGDATRGDMALMVYRTLFQEKGSVNSNTGLWDSKGTILLSNLGYGKFARITKDIISEATQYPKLSNYLYYGGNLYFNKDNQIVYFKNIKHNEYSGIIKAITGNVIILEDPNGNRKPFDVSDTPIIMNNAVASINSLINASAKVVYEEISSNDLRVKGVVATKITRVFISTSTYTGGSTFNDLIIPTTDGQPDFGKIEVSGAVSSINDIRINDVIYAYETDEPNFRKTYLEMHVVRNRVEGAMTETGSNTKDGYSIIGGRRYDHSDIYMASTPFAPGYYVVAYLDALNQVVRYNIGRDLQQPDNYGLILSLNQSSNQDIFNINLFDNTGQSKNYTVNRTTVVSLGLTAGNVIKYSLRDNMISTATKMTLQTYDGNYNSDTRKLTETDASLNSSTIIFYRSSDTWSKITLDKLDEFIKGRIIKNSSGNYVELMLLDEGIKISYPSTLFGVMMDNAMVLDANGDRVHKWQMLLDGRTDFLYSSSTYTESLNTLNNYKNQFLRLNMTEDRVRSFSVVKPEISMLPLEKFYDNNLLKVQGTFYEHSSNMTIYQATKTDTGYSITGIIGKSEVKEGDLVSLYDIYGNFDGKIDTIIVIKQ